MFIIRFWNLYKQTIKKFETFIKQSKAKEYFLIFLIANTAVFLLAIRTTPLDYDHPSFDQSWDHHNYIQMANAPFTNHTGPFCYRILMPSIVYVIPFDLQMVFYMLTYIFIVITTFLVYFLLRKMRFNIAYSITGMFLYLSLGWATKFLLFDFWLPDSLVYLMSMAIICLIWDKENKNNDLLLSIVFLLGVLAKESVLFLFPLYYTFRAKRFWDRDVAVKAILIILPSILVFILLRWAIPTYNDYEIIHQFTSAMSARSDNFSFSAVKGEYSFGAFGILLLTLPLFNIKHNSRFFIRAFPFILLVYIQLLFAINTERLLIFAFPVLIPMAIFGLKSIIDKLNLMSIVAIPLTFVMFTHLLLSSRVMPELLDPAIIFIIYLAVIFYLSVKKPWQLSSKGNSKSKDINACLYREVTTNRKNPTNNAKTTKKL